MTPGRLLALYERVAEAPDAVARLRRVTTTRERASSIAGDLVEEMVLVLEVVVDERLGGAQLVSNALHAGGTEAALVEEPRGRLEDALALVGPQLGPDVSLNIFGFEVGQDGNYSHEAIVNRTNADLANDLGNLAQRSLTMIAKNCEAKVPQPGNLSVADAAILAAADGMIQTARAAMQTQQLHLALNAIWSVVGDANRYFAASAPWELRKTDPGRMATVLWTTAEITRQIAILAQPFVPEGAGRLLDLLAIPPAERTFDALGNNGRLQAGKPLPAPAPVFPRYVEPEGEGA